MKVKYFNIVFSQLAVVLISFVLIVIFAQNRNVFLIALLFIFQLLIVEWFVLYLFSLMDVMENISDSNKLISSKKIWFLLAPIFSTVFFHFYITFKICLSVKKEFISKGLKNQISRSLLPLGILMCVTNLFPTVYLIYNSFTDTNVFGNLVTFVVINILLGLLNFIFWFLYWNQISNVALILNPGIDDHN